MKTKKSYGNKRRLVFFSIGAIIYIAIVFLVYHMTMVQTSDNLIKAYRSQQERELQNTADVLNRLYNYEEDINVLTDYVSGLSYSGERFYVLTIDGEVVFCKNSDTTNRLGTLTNPDKLYDSLNYDDTYIDSYGFNTGDHVCELSIVITRNLMLSTVYYEETRYSNFILLALLAMALLSTLEITVGFWNRAVKNFKLTEDELEMRNSHIETMSEAISNGVIDRSSADVILDVDGIADVGEDEYYNVYTMRRLLEKSNDPELMPLHMIIVKVDMSGGYIARDVIFKNMNTIKNSLKGYEVMGELRKGLFAIYIYRVSFVKADHEFRRISAVCDSITKNHNLRVTASFVDDKTRTALEIFDELVAPTGN